MDVKELRIGNNIVDCYGSINTISSIHEGGTIRFKDDTVCHIDKCKPIELAEELLLKCGFVKKGNWTFVNNNLKIKVSLCRTKFVFFTYHFEVNVNYLHQLQNLYFALTGEELTIEF